MRSAATTVRGHLHEARITVLDGASVTPRHLNKHIDYDVVPSPPGVEAEEPRDADRHGGHARRRDALRRRLRLEQGRRLRHRRARDRHLRARTRPTTSRVSGGGPSGPRARRGARPALRPHALRQRDLGDRHGDAATEIAHLPLYNPEPAAGRRTAGRSSTTRALTSSNGEASCASCHIFGDFDSLAWDLGNPDDVVTSNPRPSSSRSPPARTSTAAPTSTSSIR